MQLRMGSPFFMYRSHRNSPRKTDYFERFARKKTPLVGARDVPAWSVIQVHTHAHLHSQLTVSMAHQVVWPSMTTKALDCVQQAG